MHAATLKAFQDELVKIAGLPSALRQRFKDISKGAGKWPKNSYMSAKLHAHDQGQGAKAALRYAKESGHAAAAHATAAAEAKTRSPRDIVGATMSGIKRDRELGAEKVMRQSFFDSKERGKEFAKGIR